MARNSFAALLEGRNNFTRKFGTQGLSVDPYVSGFFGIAFTNIPKVLPDIINSYKNEVIVSDTKQIKNILSASSRSVTVPGKTINKIELTGLGGIRWAAAGNVDVDTNFSVRFLEYSGLPIFSIFHGWVKMLRDSRTGTSLLNQSTGTSSYAKSNYAANMYYWTTKPDGVTVEYAACYTGVFPLKDPGDLLSSDLNAAAEVEVDIDFNCDYIWEEPWVFNYCVNLARDTYARGTNEVYTSYRDAAGS